MVFPKDFFLTMYFTLLLTTKIVLDRKYLSYMPMVVMMEGEMRMALNSCTILCLFFNYTWYWVGWDRGLYMVLGGVGQGRGSEKSLK